MLFLKVECEATGLLVKDYHNLDEQESTLTKCKVIGQYSVSASTQSNYTWSDINVVLVLPQNKSIV